HSVRDPHMHSTLRRLETLFDAAYAINRNRAAHRAPAMGRYAGDVYFSGGAYYFSTLGAAEFCFLAAARGEQGASHATPGQSREGCPGPTLSRRTPAQEGATHASHGLTRGGNPGPTMSRRMPAQEGATHAAHGLTRGGNPGPTMSRRMPAQEEGQGLSVLGK